MNLDRPLVSIICPCYNPVQKYLKKTLDSIYEQQYSELELILIDDGSNIPFGGIKEDYTDREIPTKWIEKGYNSGVAATRNKGIEEAKGEYIAFIDAYDWWEKEKIERQVNILKKNSTRVGLVYSSVYHHFDNNIVPLKAEVEGWVYRDLLISQPLTGSSSSVMVRKDVLDEVGGFYEEGDIPEDRDLWLRIALKYQVAKDPEFMVHLIATPGSRSADPYKKAKTYIDFLKMYEELIKKEGLWSLAMADYYHGIAHKFLDRQEYFKASYNFMNSCLYHPKFFFEDIKKKLSFK